MRGHQALSAALGAITAAVVGVVLNLAVWFALHTVFRQVNETRLGPLKLEVPDLSSANLPAIGLALLAVIAVFRFKAGPMVVIPGCAVIGLVFALLIGAA